MLRLDGHIHEHEEGLNLCQEKWKKHVFLHQLLEERRELGILWIHGLEDVEVVLNLTRCQHVQLPMEGMDSQPDVAQSRPW